MTIGSGLGGSIGFATESTFGTFVAPTRFPEFESESLEWKPKRTTGKGIFAGGLVARATQRVTTTATVEGDVVTPVYSKGMGLLLGGIFGTLNTTPVQQASTTAYLQTHAFSANLSQSLSCQVGRPTMDGVVHPYSYNGLKVTKAVFDAKVDEPLRVTLTFDGRDVSESPSYTTPTYATANPALFWNQGTFEMGALGSEVAVEGVREFQLTIERPQNTSKYYLDGSGRKGEPIQSGTAMITGSITTDFLSKAAFADLFYSDTPQSIILPFVGGLISGAYNYGLTLKLPHVNWDSEPPKIAGQDIIQPTMSFTAQYDDTNVAATALYTSTDTTL